MSLHRRVFLGTLGGALAAPLSRPPNFVFILVDDLGWADLACYGSRFHETPHIDRLAREGVRFTDAYAAAPLCSPTRASILTGKCPARLQLTTALPATMPSRPSQKYVAPKIPPGLPLTEVTIAEALKPAGYVSACVGKWHLGKDGLFPQQQGFDVNIGRTATGMAPSFFYPAWKEGGRGVFVDGRPGDYLTDRLTGEAIAFIQAQKDRPFFLYLSHFAVHTFIQGKEALIEKYRRKPNPGGPHVHPVYAAMLESVDESVGRVMRTLQDLGIAEDTVVMLASDNGGEHLVQRYTKDPLPPTSNLPLREGKTTLYEGGIRVPLIVRGPRVRAGAVTNTPVISSDFLPTILEMAGLAAHPAISLDGVSFQPLLRGHSGLKREALFWYFPHYDARPVAAVRRGHDKLLEFLDDGHVELYDLARDIGEHDNLAARQPAKAARLQNMLHRWRESVNAPHMTNYSETRDPYADPWAGINAEFCGKLAEYQRLYYAQAANIDWNLGRILEAVERQGLAGDTIVVFTSDHGEMFGSHGRRAKLTFYEEAARVPFLMRWPGHIKAGAVSDACLGTPDIMPTLLGIMNLPVPRAVEGADLSRHVLGKGGAEPEAAYLQGMGTTAAWKDRNEWRALRDRRFTYAVYRRDGRELLFDNLKDPYQMKSLAEDRSQGSRLAHYRQQLRKWMKERNDTFEACTWYRDHWTTRRNVTGSATGVTQDVAAAERLVQKYFPAPA